MPRRRPQLARSASARGATTLARSADVPQARDVVAVPEGAALGHAVASARVDVHEAEADGVAVLPFEVVEQRPVEVAADVGALLDRRVEGLLGGAGGGGAVGVLG